MNQARENYLICRALFWMIEHLYRLPEDRRPQADLDDVTEIINTPRVSGPD